MKTIPTYLTILLTIFPIMSILVLALALPNNTHIVTNTLAPITNILVITMFLLHSFILSVMLVFIVDALPAMIIILILIHVYVYIYIIVMFILICLLVIDEMALTMTNSIVLY